MSVLLRSGSAACSDWAFLPSLRYRQARAFLLSSTLRQYSNRHSNSFPFDSLAMKDLISSIPRSVSVRTTISLQRRDSQTRHQASTTQLLPIPLLSNISRHDVVRCCDVSGGVVLEVLEVRSLSRECLGIHRRIRLEQNVIREAGTRTE